MQTIPHNHPRVPWRLALIVAGLTLALCLFLVLRDTLDPIRRAEAERRAEQRTQIDAQLSTLDLFVAAFWRVLPIVALPIGGGYAAWVALVIAYNRWARLDTIKADKVVALTQAQAQRFPAALTSLSFHDSSRPMIAPVAEPEETRALRPAPAPSFGELLDAGRVGADRPLLLGFDAETGQAIEGSWKSLYSCGIGALQGAGKSWLAAFLLTQSALQGGKIIVCDPHAGDDESLATRIAPLAPAFLCGVAQSEQEILSALKMARDKLDRRKAGTIAGRWPIIVVCDEWTSLLRGELGEVLPLYAADFAEQGRKYGVNALLSAQGWTKDVAGTVRNRLTAHYVLRQRPDEARYQLGIRAAALPDDIRTLPDATGYLLTVNGDLRKVVIPRMTTADIVRIGEMLADLNRPGKPPIGFRLPDTGYHQATTASAPTAPLVANGKPDGSLMVATPNQATSALQSRGSLSPDAARAYSLFQAGENLPAIVKELRGVSSNQGRRYQDALNEITDLLRQATKGA
jgi:hypothetical protein